ncbi:PDZ and C2 domain containing protein-like protein [Leptotrombidium deliense]|uniref:PDZ and C2 domain containing protein-like protein n=1 Tax=Leptotrombidium deliense TaxID=299467 RepID=A0A443SR77_9ACAR|nr:PDZ and C2 domain containing protein-like protein [Leptotrombidium deliense]
MGGKINEADNKLYAYVDWIAPAGPAEKMSLKPGDRILEWDGKSLINCSYEQVSAIIDASGKFAELLIEPFNSQRKGSCVHQKRRLSHPLPQKNSTEQEPVTGPPSPQLSPSRKAMHSSIRRKLPQTPQNVSPSDGEIMKTSSSYTKIFHA